MILRIRSNVGVWRVELADNNNNDTAITVADVYAAIQTTRPHVVYEQPLSRDPACRDPLQDHISLTEQGVTLQNGTMIHCRVDPATTMDVTAKGGDDPVGDASEATAAAPQQQQHMRRVIGKDGTIQLVPTSEAPATVDRGFRKGMLPLRDMKMHWTLSDFVAMDSQYEFKIQRQESAICKQVSLDVPSITDFQTYMQRFAFQRKRFGFLYGKFIPVDDGENNTKQKVNSFYDDDKKPVVVLGPRKARVEAIYEPPQEVDSEAAEGFVARDDAKEDKVNQIAEMLGLQKIGWIFGHEARPKGYTLSSAEIIMSAEFQLEAADGINETPFVTVTVAPSPDGTVSVEAFQVSQQCMAMVAEEALEVDGNDPKICIVNDTFTAIQEGKESKTVENSFFLTVVPIVQHTSELLVAEFPRLNRDIDDRTPSNDEMKRQLQKSGTSGWTFVDRLADFNLLVYLSQFLDVDADLPKICASIVDRDVPLDDGYKLIIKSLAGLEGSY